MPLRGVEIVGANTPDDAQGRDHTYCYNSTVTKGQLGLFLRYISVSTPPMIQQQDSVQPEQLNFKDDGMFPNSPLPLLFYRQALVPDIKDPASVFEERFAANDWTNSWQDGVYSFPHYHSTSHEVLGVYSGTANLRLGGQNGKNVKVQAGDVIVIPAGVAHQNIGASHDFGVVGAYPGGRDWDLLRGLPEERPKADHNIAALPIPDNDPIYGVEGPLRSVWKIERRRRK